MNVTEANKASVLLRWITGTRTARGAVPTVSEAQKAAEFLAGRVRLALAAGVTSEEITQRWPDVEPRQVADTWAVVLAAVDSWEHGNITSREALTVIRDQLRGTPIPDGGEGP